ncbi:unnamed protein product [Boreogadus saida]
MRETNVFKRGNFLGEDPQTPRFSWEFSPISKSQGSVLHTLDGRSIPVFKMSLLSSNTYYDLRALSSVAPDVDSTLRRPDSEDPGPESSGASTRAARSAPVLALVLTGLHILLVFKQTP